MPGTVNVINQVFLKPAITGALCVAADKFILQERYLDRSLYFGGCAALGVCMGGSMGLLIEPYLPTETFFDSATAKTVEARIIEVGFGSSAYFLVSKFVLNSPFDQNDLLKKLGILIAADIAAETLARIVDDII